jgi:hypothetical protein
MLAVQLERNLLQVQDDVGRVLYNAGDRLELVQHALDANGGDSSAFDRRKKGAAKRVADRRTEATLKRLSGKLAVLVCKCFGVDCKTLGLLKTSPKHVFLLIRLTRDAFCDYGGVLRLRVKLWCYSERQLETEEDSEEQPKTAMGGIPGSCCLSLPCAAPPCLSLLFLTCCKVRRSAARLPAG